LNPIIRGWANYHRGIVAKETFKYVDYRIWKLLWQWCRRRHCNRHKRWIKKKYFNPVGQRQWVFQGIRPGGQPSYLVYACDTPIKRHRKIKAEANPYDPTWEPYFEQRLERVWRDSEKGKRKLLTLWIEQQKRCLVCNQHITHDAGWNIHHLVERYKGGSDKLENLVLLHPNCHYQVHSLGLEVSKPVRQ
ncbi:MAG: group II intron maturase-specific domain-containing protein, partial [Oceanicoccus sp.]|uniref:group II intron maturase-specific domain-containing protein n=1 Tax=Oceanicoccus sp. TaxID=2691044 RepID=UPI0026267C21